VKLNLGTKRPPSWHRLSPPDMPFVAKRSRHVAVAIPEVRVSRGIAVNPRQKSPQPQHRQFVEHEPRLGPSRLQPVQRMLGHAKASMTLDIDADLTSALTCSNVVELRGFEPRTEPGKQALNCGFCLPASLGRPSVCCGYALACYAT
jgi:hypothetical protein